MVSPVADWPRVLVGAYYDFLFVGITTLVFLVLLRLARNHTGLQRSLRWSFLIIAFVSLVLSLVNIKFVKMVGRPFNYQWLYYSDFLCSKDAQAAIRSSFTCNVVAIGLVTSGGMYVVSRLIRGGFNLVLRKYPSGRGLAVCFLVPSLLYFPYAAWSLKNGQWNHLKLENSMVSLAGSMVTRSQPPLFTMKTSVGPADFQVTSERIAAKETSAPRVDPKVRNVLIYVLESVPAEYVEAYGSAYPVTPELNKYRKQAMFFKNIYAHAPATTKSMVSMLCAIYPWVSYQSLTAEHPTAKILSLTSELKARGYRTGFFSSSDNHFQSANKFLQARQFDVVEDFRSQQCDRAHFVDPTGNRFFLDGMDDECAADSLIGWVGRKTDKPFVAMMWTMMTHYPYFLPGPETDYGVKDEYFNRYLNALHHGDYCFGKIMRALEKKGLAESTLVVVVGDHGEAFGRHDQLTHAAKIYEENLHVPLLLINPQLFKGEEASVLGGVMDITPTVMDLLQLPAAGDWQGRSLFSQDRSPRVYFLAPWSEYWFGYGEGDRKRLFNATANRYEVYDLQKDPQETTNLAEQLPEVIEMIPQRLAAWVQYQNALIRRIISESDSK